MLKEEVPASTPMMTSGGAVSPPTIHYTASADHMAGSLATGTRGNGSSEGGRNKPQTQPKTAVPPVQSRGTLRRITMPGGAVCFLDSRSRPGHGDGRCLAK